MSDVKAVNIPNIHFQRCADFILTQIVDVQKEMEVNMHKIKAAVIHKPERLPSKLLLKTEDILKTINELANPGKPPINWFEGYPDAKAAVSIRGNELVKEELKQDTLISEDMTKFTVKDLKVVAYEGNEGGVYVEGPNSRVTVENAVINLSGPGKGVGGPGCGAAVKNQGDLTLKNVIIDSYGKSRFCTVAEQHSVLRVYDSILISHGVPFGYGIESPKGLMATPPPALEIGGNSRTHCTMSNSFSYFFNSKIICDGWGALSTETAEGFVYLEAKDCDIIVTKEGYGAYADPDCHDLFEDCRFDIDGMAVIIAGEGDVTFHNCDLKCASYLGLMHCVMGAPEEVGTLRVSGGTVRTKKEGFRVKSHNAHIELRDVDIACENGVLIHSFLNDDPCATKVSKEPYGVNLILTNMNLCGDILHEDPERDMWISLNKTTLKGAILNGILDMDMGSKWLATGDSNIIIGSDFYPAQVDAINGITIHAKGSQIGIYDLPSGGRLIVEI